MGEPARARVLMALVDGRALSASVLAAEAGMAASTISEHLAQLVDAGLLTAERHGRSRYFRLAGPEVAEVLEALARIAPTQPVRSLRQGTRANALRRARTCYNHLAGQLGVALMDRTARARSAGRGRRKPDRRRPTLRTRPSCALPTHSARALHIGRLRRARGRGAASSSADSLLHGLVGAVPSPRRSTRHRGDRSAVHCGLDPPNAAATSCGAHRCGAPGSARHLRRSLPCPGGPVRMSAWTSPSRRP